MLSILQFSMYFFFGCCCYFSRLNKKIKEIYGQTKIICFGIQSFFQMNVFFFLKKNEATSFKRWSQTFDVRLKLYFFLFLISFGSISILKRTKANEGSVDDVKEMFFFSSCVLNQLRDQEKKCMKITELEYGQIDISN